MVDTIRQKKQQRPQTPEAEPSPPNLERAKTLEPQTQHPTTTTAPPSPSPTTRTSSASVAQQRHHQLHLTPSHPVSHPPTTTTTTIAASESPQPRPPVFTVKKSSSRVPTPADDSAVHTQTFMIQSNGRSSTSAGSSSNAKAQPSEVPSPTKGSGSVVVTRAAVHSPNGNHHRTVRLDPIVNRSHRASAAPPSPTSDKGSLNRLR